MRRLVALFVLPLAIACGDEIDAGGDGIDAGPGDDPLAVDNPAPAGSLEELQRTIIQERCSGEPGLCHNGQFEPNLSTVSNTYAYLVRRPAIEDRTVLRVTPNNPDASFLIDKIRNRNGVATQMPLGAEPLTEEEIVMFEDWINGGALREPGMEVAPNLNNPPNPPEFAAFNGVNQLSGAGPFAVPVDTAISYRHSVDDFETADADIFVAGIIFATGFGNISVSGGTEDFFQTSLDTGTPPQGNSDVLNYFVDVTLGANIDVITPTGVQSMSSTDVDITPIVIYSDGDFMVDGIISFSLNQPSFQVQ